ncbi:hypothetical protein CHS0354_002029 [Potamilus streckersoni]|uniref:Lysine--tRNA ligase n=1 Tax=Potamilus streckersoni TaxID=2493646 RepID=A0AAE0T5P1_9BIVA|nr:hypothetical protein CHS0354_002029 [Potamilus streckersoni]
MGISSWVKAEAEKVLKLTEGQDMITIETGYGPSGLPHIGTFAENARTCFVIEAIKKLAPERKIRMLVFSDDFDGLRKVPLNVPNGSIMKPHLGAPLTVVPSPYDPRLSFGETNNNLLKAFLDSFGFSYEFISATDYYKSGRFDGGLKNVMDNYEAIREIFIKTIKEEKRADWSPFFAVCEKCGKINTTKVTGYNKTDYTVSYDCTADTEEYKSCGYSGTVSIFKGKTKVGWKVDWAMRWAVIGIDYEMHGEDLTESVRVSRDICKVLGRRPPLTFKYELFLDEAGEKISKKRGNGLSMEQWIEYSPLAALVYFLLGNPNAPKKMGLPILPGIVDEFLGYAYRAEEDDMTAPLWYLRRFKKAILPAAPPKITYSLLVNVGRTLENPDGKTLFDYALRYDPTIAADRAFYDSLCQSAANYLANTPAEKDAYEIESVMVPYLQHIRDYLAKQPAGSPLNGDELQSFLFKITKDHELAQRNWFLFLYNVFLQRNSGPKMGPFFAMLGRDNALKKTDEAIARLAV